MNHTDQRKLQDHGIEDGDHEDSGTLTRSENAPKLQDLGMN